MDRDGQPPARGPGEALRERVVLVLLLGLLEWLVVLTGQALVLLLSEGRSRRARLLRSFGYWVVVGLALLACSRSSSASRAVLLPMLLVVVAPLEALREWLEGRLPDAG